MQTLVGRTDDFEVDGCGSSPRWADTDWLPIHPLKEGSGFITRAKLLYSLTGIYCLFDCADHFLTCTDLKDHDDLWNEDVVEAFFWPDERHPHYFEYEISPLGAELPLLVCNDNGAFMGWSPWHYEGDRRIRSATRVVGGERAPGARVSGWSAEFFVPFALLRGLGNTPPASGTQWRANFCRIDHDAGSPELYSWSAVEGSFHEIGHFGTIRFE